MQIIYADEQSALQIFLQLQVFNMHGQEHVEICAHLKEQEEIIKLIFFPLYTKLCVHTTGKNRTLLCTICSG